MNASDRTSHFPHQLSEVLKGANFVFIIKLVKTEKGLDMFRLSTNQRQLLDDLVFSKFFDYGNSQEITLPIQTFILMTTFMGISIFLLVTLVIFIKRQTLYSFGEMFKKICFEEIDGEDEMVESKDLKNKCSEVKISNISYNNYDSDFEFSEDEIDDGFDEYVQKAKNDDDSNNTI